MKLAGGIGKTSLIILEFLKLRIQPKVSQYKITDIGYRSLVQEFARKVILSLGAQENTDTILKKTETRLLKRI